MTHTAKQGKSLNGGRSRRGQVLVMALLVISLMVGLIFLVYNTGDYINHRLAMQNVADSVAISGAGWIARSMNVIAMNNCAQARMIGLVPVFDSLPLASEIGLLNVIAYEKMMLNALAKLPRDADPNVRKNLEAILRALRAEKKILIGLNSTFNGDLDMMMVTHWKVEGMGEADPPHGSMWRTMKALEDFSYVTWQSSAVLAQANAVRFGEANGADVAVLLPMTPMLPAKVGEYSDFKPVIDGSFEMADDWWRMYPKGPGMGGTIPDMSYPYRLGPWATLFWWRWYGGGASGVFLRGASAPIGPMLEPPPAEEFTDTRTGIRSGHRQDGKITQDPWETYGPFTWAFNRVYWMLDFTVPLSNMHEIFVRIAEAKESYAFATPVALKTVHRPEWVCLGSFGEALVYYVASNAPILDQYSRGIHKTTWVHISSARETIPGEKNIGDIETSIEEYDGWVDMRGGRPELGPSIWGTEEDVEVPVPPGADNPEGNKTETIHLIDYYVFGGIDIGGDVDVRNPFNWDEQEVVNLPKPLLFDTGPVSEYEYVYNPSEPTRNDRVFGFLGIVRDDVKARVWPGRFRDISPLGGVVVLAQSKLFNNTSWDLWTQDWQVQLMPICRWEEWTRELVVGQWELGYVQGVVDEGEYNKIMWYLGNLTEDMVWQYFNH